MTPFASADAQSAFDPLRLIIRGMLLMLMLVLISPSDMIASDPTSKVPAESVSSVRPQLLDRDNLVAWCIVPFDAAKRTPTERALMLKELGLRRCAYDWRAEHVATFEDEILQYQKQGIEFFAFWSTHEDAFQLFARHNLHPQIWQTLSAPEVSAEGDRVEAAARAMLPLAQRTGDLKFPLGLYNHGGWGGEPANMVAVCKRLHELGHKHVGIVYNFHHGHDAIVNWKESFLAMQPYLLCLNINGMNDKAQPKILGVGKGQHEQSMLRVVLDSGYSGPIGILDHRSELDARDSLKENLDGLEFLRRKLDVVPTSR